MCQCSQYLDSVRSRRQGPVVLLGGGLAEPVVAAASVVALSNDSDVVACTDAVEAVDVEEAEVDAEAVLVEAAPEEPAAVEAELDVEAAAVVVATVVAMDS